MGGEGREGHRLDILQLIIVRVMTACFLGSWLKIRDERKGCGIFLRGFLVL